MPIHLNIYEMADMKPESDDGESGVVRLGGQLSLVYEN